MLSDSMAKHDDNHLRFSVRFDEETASKLDDLALLVGEGVMETGRRSVALRNAIHEAWKLKCEKRKRKQK